MTYSVEELLSADSSRWDKRIALDLGLELEALLHDKAATLPEMRQLLAVKGYREMRLCIQAAVGGLSGDDAIRAMATAMRAFAHDRPGLSAATFRNHLTDCPMWRQEGHLLQTAALEVFAGAGICGEHGVGALRILRALVRGFVLHEMASSFLEDVDYDTAFKISLDVYVRGLDELKPVLSQSRTIVERQSGR